MIRREDHIGDKVGIAWLESPETGADFIIDRLRDYLSLHGLQAVEHGINPGSQGTAVTLIDAAQNAGAGVLVMGGYEHSRLREIALGGVTRHILSHATMPVFLAH